MNKGISYIDLVQKDNYSDLVGELQYDSPEIPVEQYFMNEESDFYNYMLDKALFKNKNTYHDYMTRLRYVSRFFRLDKFLTKKRVAEIVEELKRTMSKRQAYNSSRGVSDLASGLNRFLEYIESDYRKKLDDSILKDENEVKNNATLTPTEKEAIIKARVGQGVFRQKLIEYWKGCSVTQCRTYPLLVASHIKPWKKSDNIQRLDVFNGLLLIPNIDKLFDKGYISFDMKGRMIFSDFLTVSDRKLLGVNSSMSLKSVDDFHLPYLKYHRENCLM